MDKLIHVGVLVGISAAVGVVTELINKRLIYSNEDYQSLTSKIQRNAAKIEDTETRPVSLDRVKARDRLLAQLKRDQSMDQQKLAGIKLRGTVITSLLSIGVLYALSYIYDGMALLRLPFTPFGFFTAMTHRGVPGEDMRDAGYLFVFVMASMFVRPLVPKIMGTEQPRIKGGIFDSAMAM